MDEVRDLGVTISADLSWKSHIGSMVAKGRSFAAWVLSVFRSREPDVMMTLYKTYVRSQLEYCSALWHPQCIEDLSVVEGVHLTLASHLGCLPSAISPGRRGDVSDREAKPHVRQITGYYCTNNTHLTVSDWVHHAFNF